MKSLCSYIMNISYEKEGLIRGSLEMQIIDDLRIPNGRWGEASWLEPITKSYPQYGPGGATQAVTNQKIKLDSLIDLLK